MSAMERVHEIARRVSNWGRWGDDDERGTMNYVTPEVIARAATLVRRGDTFSLSLRFDRDGPQIGQSGRINPVHLMSATAGALPGSPPDGFRFADDFVTMPLQCATQWDSLAHVFYAGKLYNGFPAETVTTFGAMRNSIDKLGPVVSRGVLLDLARVAGVDRLPGGHVVTPADLEAAEQAAGVEVGSGDVLLLRTGWMRTFTVDQDRVAYMKSEPGIGLESVEWLHARQVAAVAADTMAVEVYPGEDPDLTLPVHMLCIRDMGLTLGEMFDLEHLAEDCAGDGVFEFLFTATPLRVTGAVGSPIHPVAIK